MNTTTKFHQDNRNEDTRSRRKSTIGDDSPLPTYVQESPGRETESVMKRSEFMKTLKEK